MVEYEELAFMDATAQAELVRKKEIKAKELVEAAIERIERYAIRGRDAFEGDELVQSWFVRHLQVIGEAVRTLP